jgi:hypothetical protein
LNAQIASVCPPTVPVPVLFAESDPFRGSTTTEVAAAPRGSHAAQTFVVGLQAGVPPPAPHWLFEQQLPGTQARVVPQQMSAALAVHAVPSVGHVLDSHVWEVVLQIVDAP